MFKEFANAREHLLPSRSKLVWDQLLVPLAAHRLNVDLLFNPKFSLPLLSATPGVFVLQSCDWYVNPGNYPWLQFEISVVVLETRFTRTLSDDGRVADNPPETGKLSSISLA